MASPNPTPRNLATLLGMLSILFWSASVAFTRSLAESLGTFTANALIYGGGGLLGCGFLLLRGRLRLALALPRTYLVAGGALFSLYLVTFSVAIGLAHSGQQLVELGLVNYLWPALTLVLSVPLLKHRARPWLWPGLLLALCGVALSSLGDRELTLLVLADTGRIFLENLQSNPLAYGLMLVGALSWSLFSNLSRKLAGERAGTAVPLFLLLAGVVLFLFRLFVQEPFAMSVRSAWELSYMILFPGLLAYWFWEFAMRRGRLVLVAAWSYLIPLLSTWITVGLFGVAAGPGVWLGCGLTILGAVICQRAVLEPGPAHKTS